MRLGNIAAPHSPRRQKLNLRMKSLSLDSPESTEQAQKRRAQASHSGGHSSQSSSSKIHCMSDKPARPEKNGLFFLCLQFFLFDKAFECTLSFLRHVPFFSFFRTVVFLSFFPSFLLSPAPGSRCPTLVLFARGPRGSCRIFGGCRRGREKEPDGCFQQVPHSRVRYNQHDLNRNFCTHGFGRRTVFPVVVPPPRPSPTTLVAEKQLLFLFSYSRGESSSKANTSTKHNFQGFSRSVRV